MKERITKNGIDYVLVGDYYIFEIADFLQKKKR